MTNEKITAMPVKKTQIHLTATLSLPLRLHERGLDPNRLPVPVYFPGPADPGGIAGRRRI